jgi:aspartyl-tRNA(Asn)/glutamyl-tRNA(Gln) amidotransferase subunit B
VQETRLWDADRNETRAMRSKEDAHDYRYFPDPDLPPLVVDDAWREEIRAALPELPAQRRARFVAQYALPDYDAGVLTLSREVADYFETVVRAGVAAKAASNWVMTEVLRKQKEEDRPLASAPVGPEALAGLIGLVEMGSITGTTAKGVFETMWTTGASAESIVDREGLRQVTDDAALQAAIDEVIASSAAQVATYRGGKTSTLGWFVGQVMRRTAGKANAQRVGELLKKALDR